MKTFRPRLCKKCGQRFEPTSGYNLFCSKECGKNRQKVAREEGRQGLFCVVCSKSFVPKAPRPLTCSKECSREMERRRKRVPPAPRVCVECGQQFVPSQNSRYQLSCSKECSHKRTRREIRLRESERMMVPSFRERRYAMRRLRTEWAKSGDPWDRERYLLWRREKWKKDPAWRARKLQRKRVRLLKKAAMPVIDGASERK